MIAGQGTATLEAQMRARLQASADALPARIRSRLAQARSAALQAPRRPAWLRFAWAPAGAATAAAVVAGVLLWNGSVRHSPVPPLGAAATVSAEDLDLLTDADALTLTQAPAPAPDDYGFYEWAAQAGGAPAPGI